MILIYLFIATIISADATTRNYLEIIDKYLGAKSLCEAFPNNQQHLFERENCSLFGCDKWDYIIRTQCASEVAVLEYIHTNGQVFSRQEIRQLKWAEHFGNAVRMFKETTESYGNQFEIVELIYKEDILNVHYQIFREAKLISTGEWHLKAKNIYDQFFWRSESTKLPIKEVKTDMFKN